VLSTGGVCRICHRRLPVDSFVTRRFCGKACQMRDQRRRRKLVLVAQLVAVAQALAA
jgi:hypothetical protein